MQLVVAGLSHPAVTVQAGTQRRTIASLAATDPDLEDRVRWSLVRVEPRYCILTRP